MIDSSLRHKDGIVLAIKPEEMGSAALVGRLKKEAGLRKAGHAGTLDRFATGLMILLTNKATPFADYFLHRDKEYIAILAFGAFTDTHDSHGTILDVRPPEISRQFITENLSRIQNIVAGLVHESVQIPPHYSALKRDGKRVSDKVRGGEEVNLEPRPVRIYESEILSVDPEGCTLTVRFKVSSGTYIRAIARDFSNALEYPLHLSGLMRTQIDQFSINDPHIWIPGKNEPRILNPAELLPQWKRRVITDTGDLNWISHGRKVTILELPEKGENFFLLNGDGWPIAWCVSHGNDYDYRRVFQA